jgi:hypothetical protein
MPNRVEVRFLSTNVTPEVGANDGLERRAFSVQAMHPIKDKRARLRVAARYIKMGIVTPARVRSTSDATFGLWRGKA